MINHELTEFGDTKTWVWTAAPLATNNNRHTTNNNEQRLGDTRLPILEQHLKVSFPLPSYLPPREVLTEDTYFTIVNLYKHILSLLRHSDVG